VRVNDEIRLDTTLRERHVDRRPQLRADTLLSVTRRELVTDNRLTRNPVLDAQRLAWLRARLRTHDPDTIDVSLLGILVLHEMRDAVDVDV